MKGEALQLLGTGENRRTFALGPTIPVPHGWDTGIYPAGSLYLAVYYKDSPHVLFSQHISYH
jgi:hypothetical protein